MQEVEIKLQVPTARRSALLASITRGRCVSTRLKARYFDTPGHELAAAGFALRMRREGRRWVQTLKRSHDGTLARFEHEVALGGAAAPPAPDLARHAGSADGDAAIALLAAGGGVLLPLFDIDVRRTSRCVRHGGAMIELAFDEGAIQAGDAREPLCELELELVSGPLDALGALACRFALRHGLWLDVRSKAERGYRLAGAASAGPAPASPIARLHDDDTALDIVRACMRAALAQLLPCTSALAAGAEDAELVHQARVALRRLLSVWREFGDAAGAIDASWTAAARTLFDRLGATRDRDIIVTLWQPLLLAAGAPPPLPAPSRDETQAPAAACRDPATTAALITWLVHAHAATAPADNQVGDAMAAARARLGRLHRRLRRAGKSFGSLADDERHRARRQLKRLRYCAEALSSLFPRAAWTQYLQRLKRAQDALGRLQDWTLAQQHFATCDAATDGVWFARGWLAARRDACIDDAGRALAAIGKRPRFLR